MNKKLGIIFFLVIFCFQLNAQTKLDSLTEAKYKKDSVNFINFPDCVLLDSIIPDKKIIKWELNRVDSWDGSPEYRNLYRSSHAEKLKKDSVMEKFSDGFGTICAPGWCSWYVTVEKKDTLYSIGDINSLSGFIGSIDNVYDAYFWLISHDLADHTEVPLKILPKARYKILKDGYLIELHLMINTCPITFADELYFVPKNKKIKKLRRKITEQGTGCI
ncbi:MAG: hypothetical protein V4556_08170 [Bacteroidota bacterium]